MSKEQGTVKWFDPKRGFGFIRRANGEKEIFVHQSSIQMDGYRTLSDGQVVEFEAVVGKKGLEASNVKPVGE